MSFVVGSNNQKCALNMLSHGACVVEDTDLYPACKMFIFIPFSYKVNDVMPLFVSKPFISQNTQWLVCFVLLGFCCCCFRIIGLLVFLFCFWGVLLFVCLFSQFHSPSLTRSVMERLFFVHKPFISPNMQCLFCFVVWFVCFLARTVTDIEFKK